MPLTGALCANRSVAEQDTGDDAGRHRRQHIVAADLHPVVAARRRAQAMRTPVVDHVLAVVIVRRQAPAAVEVVARTGAARFTALVAAVVTVVAARFAMGVAVVAAFLALL